MRDTLEGKMWRGVALALGDSQNRPFMIGICQGQTELSSPLLPTAGC